MKRTLLLLTILFAATSIQAQSYIRWQHPIGGSEIDLPASITHTFDNGYIVGAITKSTDYDVSGYHGGSGADFWITKLDSSGNIVWAKALGGSETEAIGNVIQCTDTGYIAVGSSYSINGDVTGNHGSSDIWVVKLSASGDIQWQKCFGGSYEDEGSYIQQTIDGGFVIAGTTSSVDGDASGHFSLHPDFFVLKITNTGTIEWKRFIGGSGVDYLTKIRQTTDTGYIVLGYAGSPDGGIVGWHGGIDGWIGKLDDTGALLWNRCYGGSDADYLFDIRQTNDLGFIAVGTGQSTDGDYVANHGTWDAMILKLSATGTTSWTRILGAGNIDELKSVTQTPDGNYMAVGTSASTEGEMNYVPYSGAGDLWVLKFAPGGTTIRQSRFGGNSGDNGNDIQLLPDSTYIVAADSYSNSGDVTGAHGAGDAWILQLGNCSIANPVITASVDTLSTTTPFATYQWYLSGSPISGATNATYDAFFFGTYHVLVTDTAGCQAASAGFAYSYIPVGAVSTSADHDVMIYPNPVGNSGTIHTSTKARLLLTDMMGATIREETEKDEMSVADLPPSIYLLSVFDSSGHVLRHEKIIR